MEHIFLHCTVAWDLWGPVFSSFRINWVLVKVIDLLFGWRSSVGNHSSDIWNLVAFMFVVVTVEGTKLSYF
jgi:hypothetical protein